MRESPSDMVERIARSDRVYFEMAATVGVLRGAELAWMPELQKLPGGCVVQRVNRAAVGEHVSLWLRGVEASIRDLGGSVARFYMDEGNAIPDRDMLHAGYRRRMETAYLLMPPGKPGGAGGGRLRLRRVSGDESWRERRLLQEACDECPDGYRCRPAEWVLLERRKCRTGGMKLFLAEENGEVLASAGTIRIGPLLRCKNMTVRPGAPDRVGPAVIGLLAEQAAGRGLSAVGALAVAGTDRERICRDAGMVSVGRVFEWSKPLGD